MFAFVVIDNYICNPYVIWDWRASRKHSNKASSSLPCRKNRKPCDRHSNRCVYPLRPWPKGSPFLLRHGHVVKLPMSFLPWKRRVRDPLIRNVNDQIKPSCDRPVYWLGVGEYLAIWVRTAPAVFRPNSDTSLSNRLTSSRLNAWHICKLGNMLIEMCPVDLWPSNLACL